MKLFSPFPENYTLIDAGGGRKLERWGTVVTIRPEHQAYFKPELSPKDWKEQADWEFIPKSQGSLIGVWKQLNPKAPREWTMQSNLANFQLQLTQNKHIGLFPEQNTNWEFIAQHLGEGKRFLNTFAYTGAASVIGKKTSAEVIHVDSVRAMLDWGRQNMELNYEDGISWVLEDALKFVKREVKRGNTYDIVQMDPPAWGLGAKGEKWKLEQLLPELVAEALALINVGGTLIVNTYSPKITTKELQTISIAFPKNVTSTIQELWMETTTGKKLFYGNLLRVTRFR